MVLQASESATLSGMLLAHGQNGMRPCAAGGGRACGSVILSGPLLSMNGFAVLWAEGGQGGA